MIKNFIFLKYRTFSKTHKKYFLLSKEIKENELDFLFLTELQTLRKFFTLTFLPHLFKLHTLNIDEFKNVDGTTTGFKAKRRVLTNPNLYQYKRVHTVRGIRAVIVRIWTALCLVSQSLFFLVLKLLLSRFHRFFCTPDPMIKTQTQLALRSETRSFVYFRSSIFDA